MSKPLLKPTPNSQLTLSGLATWFGLAVIWVSLILGQLARISLTADIRLYLHDIVIALWVVSELTTLSLPLYRRSISTWYRNHRWSLALVAWIGFGIASSILVHGLDLTGLLYVGRLAVYILWGVLLSRAQVLRKEIWQWGIVSIGFFTAVIGLVLYMWQPDMRFLTILGWDDHLYRLVGTQLDPNFTGLLLVMSVGLWWGKEGMLLGTHLRKHRWWLSSAVSFSLIVALSLTFSRASYLCFGGLLVAWKHTTNQWKHFIWAIVLILLVALAPKPTGEGVDLTRTSTITSRVTNTVEFTLLPHEWLLGQGLLMTNWSPRNPLYPYPDHARFPDNFLVLALTQLGIGGLILLGMTLYQELVQNRKEARTSYLIPIGTAIVIHSCFNHSLLQSFVLVFALLIVASQTPSELPQDRARSL